MKQIIIHITHEDYSVGVQYASYHCASLTTVLTSLQTEILVKHFIVDDRKKSQLVVLHTFVWFLKKGKGIGVAR